MKIVPDFQRSYNHSRGTKLYSRENQVYLPRDLPSTEHKSIDFLKLYKNSLEKPETSN